MTSVILEADGGSRGNPGPAGYGAVVFDASRSRVLAERFESIGTATNNVAEYRGLIAGLDAAAELGASSVSVRMDSKLVVEQMSGRWKVKHADMIPLAERARQLAARFDHVDYTWIPRAENSHADGLANRAMDGDIGSLRSPSSLNTGWTGAQGKPTRLLLARHGQTPLSVERRYSGRGNPQLTDVGRNQAELLAKRIGAKGGIDAVVTSPLARARETAAACANVLGLDYEVVDGLIETDFGAWEGLTFGQAAERDPVVHRNWLADTAIAPPGGESFDAVAARVEACRAALVERFPASNVLVVTHVTPIKMFLRSALGVGPGLLYRLHLDLASLSIAEFYGDGGSVVRLVNDTSHLDQSANTLR